MTAKISSYLQQMSDYVYFLRLSPFPSGGIQIKTVSPIRPQWYTQINNSYSLLEQSAIERSILIAQNVLVRFRSGSENGRIQVMLMHSLYFGIAAMVTATSHVYGER